MAKMQLDFTDKRVLVTGATRGIGRGAVEFFLRSGARVAVNGRTKKSTDDAIESLRCKDMLIAAAGDVATAQGCKSIVETAILALGGLDVLVNSAGIGEGARIEEVDETAWDRMLDVNLKGTFFCIQSALPTLRSSKGNVVNIASDAGTMGCVPNMVAYCASKGAVVNMTRAMALELAPDVRVNCVCPGYVDTDMVRRDLIDKATDPATAERELANYAPLQRIADVEEIANAIGYLASYDARNVTGTALQIDGGSTAGR
jgi:NAD(P)-dependent dehydrogenase (short-subunit alcohol dehydrogenase family)